MSWSNRLTLRHQCTEGAKGKRQVELAVIPSGAIRYTLNGANPKEGTVYEKPFSIGPEDTTVYCYAEADGISSSRNFAGVMVSMVCFGLAVLPMGRYVLLADRLVWLPYRGVPVELPLSTLEADGVTLTRRNAGISIRARTTLSLPVVTSPVQLATLLLLYREGPLKGVDGPPSGTVVILPGWCTRAGPDVEGVTLLYSAGVCFLPKGAAPAVLQRLASTRLEVPISEAFLLEQLTRLPTEALGPVLSQASQVPGGLYARAEDVTADPGARSAQKLRLRLMGALLEIPIGSVDYEALRTLFPWTQDTSRHVP